MGLMTDPAATTEVLDSTVPVDSSTRRTGSLRPTEIIDLRNASSKSEPMQATSPVEAISTPRIGSAPSSRVNENCGALTPT